MHDGRRRERSCDGKRRYASKDAARAALIRFARTMHDETMTFYRCRWCGGWHLGHKRQPWQ